MSTGHAARTYDDQRTAAGQTSTISTPVVQHTTDANRQKRRALINAIGARQFKKLYRKAQV